MTVSIMVTAGKDVKTVVEAIKNGAFDYIVKPLDAQELLMAVEKAAEQAVMKKELSALRSAVEEACGKGEMIGASPAMLEVQRQINRFSHQDLNVLVTGESGTGKELIARAIHDRGSRARGPFVAVNCSLFGCELTESELFGHEKGAFTGALQMHRGKFEQADGGTLFLDEIGTMSPQVRVLGRDHETARTTPVRGGRARCRGRQARREDPVPVDRADQGPQGQGRGRSRVFFRRDRPRGDARGNGAAQPPCACAHNHCTSAAHSLHNPRLDAPYCHASQ